MKCRVVWILAAVLLLTSVAMAGESHDRNVDVELTIKETGADGGETSRTFELLTLEGRRTELLAGWRIPIATAVHAADSEPAGTFQSFTYQNVGATIQLETRIDGEKRIYVAGQVEISDVQKEPTPRVRQPTIGTFQYDFAALLSDADPVVVARMPRQDGGSFAIAVKAVARD